ncbi:MAG: hypothetical protein H0X62_01715 [Bacteroidetes bacterium]|nr:hypothetical protein [Bacteroidota bacterium]
MKELALDYEYLIRRCHQCGRYGVPGANADTYRGLITKSIRYKEAKEKNEKGKSEASLETFIEASNEYFYRLGEVTAYLDTALEIGKKKFKSQLSETDIDNLDKIQEELYNADLDRIDTIIKKAEKIFVNAKIFP